MEEYKEDQYTELFDELFDGFNEFMDYIKDNSSDEHTLYILASFVGGCVYAARSQMGGDAPIADVVEALGATALGQSIGIYEVGNKDESELH